MMRNASAILGLLILTACNDVVTSRFATLEEAKLERAFERGWLPALMPASAREIVEENNVDLNTGSGAFVYDLAERSAYLGRLQQAGATVTQQQERTVIIFATNRSRWEIELPRRKGEAHYRIRQVPNQAGAGNGGGELSLHVGRLGRAVPDLWR